MRTLYCWHFYIVYKYNMPRKFRRKKTRRKRRRRSQQLARTGSGYPLALPFPRTKKFRTRYVEYQVALDPGAAGTMASALFSWNGLYDPRTAVGGHQPIGFDQMMGMYNLYQVIGARARVTFINNDTTYAQIVTLSTQEETGIAETEPTKLIENGRCRWAQLAPHGSGGSVKTLSLNWSGRRIWGKNSYSDANKQGTDAANPTDESFLRLTACPQAAADSSDVRCIVELDYIAILSSPKLLAQS